MLKIAKTVPFGSHLSTRLEGANNKLVCALSATTTCVDDGRPVPLDPTVPIWTEPTLV